MFDCMWTMYILCSWGLAGVDLGVLCVRACLCVSVGACVGVLCV